MPALYIIKGVASFVDDDRKAVLIEICEYLKENYFQYGRAICYLEQLAGVRAMPRTPPKQLDFLLVPQVGVQRGAIAMDEFFAMDCVQKHITPEVDVQSIPAKSMKSFFLPPWAFDFSESSKYGAVGRFTTNHQYSMHFPSFLDRGLESHREAIDVKFTANLEDKSLDKVHPFSVGFVDGQCKALIFQSILGMLHVLVTCQNHLCTFSL
eukprot:s1235_g3.t1